MAVGEYSSLTIFFSIFLYIVVQCFQSAYGINENNQCQSNIIRVANSSYEVPQLAIIKGYEATIKEFPYAVRLYLINPDSLGLCSGQAVHLHLILTAAHCVSRRGTIIVVAGNADHNDYRVGKNLEKYSRYRVSEVFVHPNFDAFSLVHDVAILKLRRNMIHEGHKLINISYDQITGPVNATIFGWGGTELSNKNNKLVGKHLMISNCSLPNPTDWQYLCLMEHGICHGDSGGGLIINETLYGIASFRKVHNSDHPLKNRSYYYTALWKEEAFVKEIMAKNGINYISPLQFFIFGDFILILIFSNNYILF